jgi:enoyl-CoA hydratase
MEEIQLERRGAVAIVSFTTPRTRNAITRTSARALVAACEEVDADPSIGALVVRGEGGYFCSGAHRDVLADHRELSATPELYTRLDEIYHSFLRLGAVQVPTVAAIRGGAFGAGVNLALATDLRVVASDAKLSAGFIRLGLHAGGGHFHLVNALAGPEIAAGLGLFGQAIDGERAQQLGLAWRAVPDAEVDDLALEIAQVPAADPELARLTARSLRFSTGSRAAWSRAVELEHGVQTWSFHRQALGQSAVAPTAA